MNENEKVSSTRCLMVLSGLTEHCHLVVAESGPDAGAGSRCDDGLARCSWYFSLRIVANNIGEY